MVLSPAANQVQSGSNTFCRVNLLSHTVRFLLCSCSCMTSYAKTTCIWWEKHIMEFYSGHTRSDLLYFAILKFNRRSGT